jgi:glycosyltransferase involved in cell wall biosynthesis
MDRPLVSVIIPTYNSSGTLGACLESVKAQTYPHIEMIVVDNYSIDETSKIAESYGAKTLLRGPERSAQMNYGVLNARGEYILRIDSDMVADSDIIEKCLRLCYKRADAVVLPVLPHISVCNNFWVHCRMLEQKMIIDDMVNVAPRFIKRSVFLAIGGYDETIVAWEDYDLHNRLLKSGYRVALLQDSALWHLGEFSSLREVVVRMVRYGKTGSLGLFIKKHGSVGLRQISIVRPAFIRHRDYFLTDPLHYMGLMFMKIVQASSFAFGAAIRHVP